MTQVVNLGEVIAQPKGSALVANASGGASTLTIDYAGEFSAGGGTLELNGVQMDYDSITEGAAQYDPDVINLTGTLANAASIGDWVSVAAGGQALVDYVAVCATDDGDEVRVPITDQQIPFYAVGVYDPAVPVFVSDDLQRLESAPGRTPPITADGIIGVPLKTADDGPRIVVQVEDPYSGDPQGVILFYTDNAREDPALPGRVYADGSNVGALHTTGVFMAAPALVDDSGVPVAGIPAVVSLGVTWNSTTDTASSQAGLEGGSVLINATDETLDLTAVGDVNIASTAGDIALDPNPGGVVTVYSDLNVAEKMNAAKSFQSSVINSPSGAANVVRTISVAFATAFDVPPVVTATIAVAASVARVRAWVDPASVTTTGCDIFALREDNSGPYDVHWQATAPTQ